MQIAESIPAIFCLKIDSLLLKGPITLPQSPLALSQSFFNRSGLELSTRYPSNIIVRDHRAIFGSTKSIASNECVERISGLLYEPKIFGYALHSEDDGVVNFSHLREAKIH